MLEELLDMSGIAVALASLLSLIQRDPGARVLRLDHAPLPDVSRSQEPAGRR